MTNEERLIKIEIILEGLKKDFDNHLTHHFRYSIMAWGLALAALIGLIIK